MGYFILLQLNYSYNLHTLLLVLRFSQSILCFFSLLLNFCFNTHKLGIGISDLLFDSVRVFPLFRYLIAALILASSALALAICFLILSVFFFFFAALRCAFVSLLIFFRRFFTCFFSLLL